MRLLSRKEIAGKPGKSIELLQGDLTDSDPQHPFDLLIVSAFPNDYIPTSGSLIGALYRKGLSVGRLANEKELDLRTHFSCWLSRDTSTAELGFKRILCFEPLTRGSPPDVIGDIFRALMPILGDRPELRSVAMPIVAAGDASWPVDKILPPLLEAAIQWMNIGLPIDVIKIVAFSNTQAAKALGIFNAWQSPEREIRPSEASKQPEYDVFLSYAHEEENLVKSFCEILATQSPKTRLFLDRLSISIGAAWQPAIFESLDHCRKVVAMLSPAYLGSKVCKEEFNIAWARSRESDLEIIFPVYLYTAKLPTYMTYRNYFDCREGSTQLLNGACAELLRSLKVDI